MTGGSSSIGSSTQKVSVAFYLRDEISVLKLLKKIHHSILPVDTKNELRDMIFSFRAVPDAQVTDTLRTTFAEYGFTVLGEEEAVTAVEELSEVFTPEVVKTQKPLNRMGNTRMQPRFTPASISTASQTSRVAPVAQSVEPTKVEISEPEQPIAEQPINEPAAEVPDVLTPEPVVASGSESTTSTADRIKEIKKEVNTLVGNPVNLIDVNNEVGREYMSALLDAMKKTNGGSSGEVEAAMVRLETAFASVQVTVGSKGIVQDTVPPEQKTAPVSETSANKKIEQVPAEPIVEPTPAAIAPDDASKPVAPVTAPAVSGFASVHQTHVPEVVAETVSPVVETSPAPAVASSPEVAKLAVTPVPNVAPVVPEVENASSDMLSVAKEKQIADLLTSQKQEAAVTDKQRKDAEIASLDPLMTPDVTNGLNQLISEWGLFKSSGLFGTGPSGVEHPLYKKLSQLTMSAIVAGRFDEATPQIKRSITDYMNGWRYEEGILHEHGETFEHYLRRVIKHILGKKFTDTPVA